jgi:ASC-1-like (ASCH) protein
MPHMTIYEMKLQPESFAAVVSGTKIIESRLYDEKRQKIQLGDRILFRNMENMDEAVMTQVEGLLRYKTFSAMFHDFPSSSFGGDSKEVLEKQIYNFYSREDEAKYGVLGIRISKLGKTA